MAAMLSKDFAGRDISRPACQNETVREISLCIDCQRWRGKILVNEHNGVNGWDGCTEGVWKMDLCGVVSGIGKLFNVQEGKLHVQEENEKTSRIVVS